MASGLPIEILAHILTYIRQYHSANPFSLHALVGETGFSKQPTNRQERLMVATNSHVFVIRHINKAWKRVVDDQLNSPPDESIVPRLSISKRQLTPEAAARIADDLLRISLQPTAPIELKSAIYFTDPAAKSSPDLIFGDVYRRPPPVDPFLLPKVYFASRTNLLYLMCIAIQVNLLQGYLNVAKWIWSHLSSLETKYRFLKHASLPTASRPDCLPARIAYAGRLDCIEWLVQIGCAIPQWKVAAAAARGGHLAILQWMEANFPHDKWHLRQVGVLAAYDEEYSIGYEALKGGHYDIYQWAQARNATTPDQDPGAAALFGDVDIFRRLTRPPAEQHRYNTIVKRAIEGGSLPLLESIPIEEFGGEGTRMYDIASCIARGENYHLIPWVNKNCHEISINSLLSATTQASNYTLIDALLSNQLFDPRCIGVGPVAYAIMDSNAEVLRRLSSMHCQLHRSPLDLVASLHANFEAFQIMVEKNIPISMRCIPSALKSGCVRFAKWIATRCIEEGQNLGSYRWDLTSASDLNQAEMVRALYFDNEPPFNEQLRKNIYSQKSSVRSQPSLPSITKY